MYARRTWIVALFVSLFVFCSIPAFAQNEFAFTGKKIKTVYPGDCDWVTCSKVTLTPPGNGFVVVTAAGFADFQRDDSALQLTLNTRRHARGPSIFTLTPGYKFRQTYSARLVFAVDGGKEYTFYLSGNGCNGTGQWIDVINGSMTAEFHPESETQPQAAQPSEAASKEPAREDSAREHRQ